MKFSSVIFALFALSVKISDTTGIDKSISLCDRNKSPTNSTFFRLPKTIKPIRYKIRFRSDASRFKFYGSEVILIMINERTDIIELNSVDLVIESAWFRTRRIKVDARSACACPDKGTVVLEFPKFLERGRGNLTINFQGNVNNMVTGFFNSNLKTPTEEGLIAVTDFGPTDARRAFPSWDEPAFKAMFDLILISPSDHFTLTNMIEANRRPYSEGLDEIKFRTSPPMSTNLVAIVVGKFDLIEKMTDDNQVLVRVFTPIDRKDDGVFALDLSSQLLLFYKYYFNITYPLQKLDLISIPDFPSSMENWGLITFTERQILVNNETSEQDRRDVAVAIAHGLAHQWFGNLVTLDSWNQLWLSEGFTTFVENIAIDILYRNWNPWKNFVSNELQNALEFDALKTSRPIESETDSPSEFWNPFNDFLYEKSTSIIRMLNRWIGNEIFRNGIRSFIAKHEFTSASANDFWNSFQTKKDLKVAEMMNTWIKQKGLPVITVKERQEGTKRILTLTQEKLSAIGKLDGYEKSQLWHIPIKVTNLFSPFTPSAEILMKSKQINLTVEGIHEGEWVKLNPDSFGFYRVNYPVEMLNKFISSIEDKSMPPLDRLNILSDLFAVIQSGRVSTEVGLRILKSYSNEDDSAILKYILRLVAKLDLILSDTDLREKFWSYGRELLNKMYNKIGWDKQPNEDLAITKLRPRILSLLGLFREQSVITEAIQRFKDYVEERDNFNNDTIFLSAIYKIVGANGNADTFEQLFEMYRNAETPEKRNLIAMALGSTDQKDLILKVLDFSLSDEVRHVDSSKMIARLGHSMIGRDKTWKFFQDYFEEFRRRFGSSIRGMNALIKNFIEKFSSEDKANEFEQFFKINKLPGLQESIEQSIERIRVNAKWLNRDIIAIREYFTKDTPN